MNFSDSDFRRAMGRFPSGITVVTLKDTENNYKAMTVNSFASVSLSPPLILFSINKDSQNYDDFANSKNYNINFLSEHQKTISHLFSKPSALNWNEIDYTIADNFCPIIKNCISYIQCVPEHIYAGGDHSIIVCMVNKIEILSDEKPLIFYKGKYNIIGEEL